MVRCTDKSIDQWVLKNAYSHVTHTLSRLFFMPLPVNPLHLLLPDIISIIIDVYWLLKSFIIMESDGLFFLVFHFYFSPKWFSVISLHLYCCMYQQFVPFYCRVVLYFINMLQFIHSSVDGYLLLVISRFSLLQIKLLRKFLFKMFSVLVFISIG